MSAAGSGAQKEAAARAKLQEEAALAGSEHVGGTEIWRFEDPCLQNLLFDPGQRVLLHGLQARPDLNGCTGYVVSFDAAKDRYAVKVSKNVSQTLLLLKPSSLERVPSAATAVAVREAGGAEAPESKCLPL